VTRDAGRNSAFKAMSSAVLSIASNLRVEEVLQQLVDVARELAGARYAAIGVPDGDGGFAAFITSGMSPAQLEALGELPRTHGLLGAMLEGPEPFRTGDIQQDPRFEGWPEEHPSMHSFLGVPIVSRSQVIGAVYLTDKRGQRRGTFTDEDQELIEMLAAHAAVAIENARLYERSRELSIVEERTRLARELHDSVAQTMLNAVVTAEAAARLFEHSPARAREEVLRVVELTREAMAELRAMVFELRPAALEQEGLVPALRKHADVLERVHGVRIGVDSESERRLEPRVEQALFRIAQEALGNAVKHSGAAAVHVRARLEDGSVVLSVADDGCGFEPAAARARSGRLGLTSMHERAEALGAMLGIESGASAGTTVSLELSGV
jgi:signal transduction histidine kinase